MRRDLMHPEQLKAGPRKSSASVSRRWGSSTTRARAPVSSSARCERPHRRPACADMDALGRERIRWHDGRMRLQPRLTTMRSRRALPARDAQLRWHCLPHLPAGRGATPAPRRSRTASSNAFRPSRSSRCTTGPVCRRAASESRPGRRWPRRTASIKIDGRGARAHPHAAIDPVLVAAHIITAQSIVSPT